jgi:hypothetical protein
MMANSKGQWGFGLVACTGGVELQDATRPYRYFSRLEPFSLRRGTVPKPRSETELAAWTSGEESEACVVRGYEVGWR